MKIRYGTQVKLSHDILDKIYAHANEACLFYSNHNNRSIVEKKEHIIRGKIAEYGYYMMCKEAGIPVSEPDLTNHKNGDDGGHDLVVNNVTVDVKSLDAAKRGYSQMPISSLRAEAYVLCWVDMHTKTVIYEGAITRKTIQLNNILESAINPTTFIKYTYVHKGHLSQLNENFQ